MMIHVFFVSSMYMKTHDSTQSLKWKTVVVMFRTVIRPPRIFSSSIHTTRHDSTHSLIWSTWVVMWEFFLWGGGEIFSKWLISSHIRIQISRESVRLIELITLDMFLIHIVYWRSLKKISSMRFRPSVLKNWLKMALFGVFRAFTGNFLYYNLYWSKLKVITRP